MWGQKYNGIKNSQSLTDKLDAPKASLSFYRILNFDQKTQEQTRRQKAVGSSVLVGKAWIRK